MELSMTWMRMHVGVSVMDGSKTHCIILKINIRVFYAFVEHLCLPNMSVHVCVCE